MNWVKEKNDDIVLNMFFETGENKNFKFKKYKRGSFWFFYETTSIEDIFKEMDETLKI
jgi:hypothetical protein